MSLWSTAGITSNGSTINGYKFGYMFTYSITNVIRYLFILNSIKTTGPKAWKPIFKGIVPLDGQIDCNEAHPDVTKEHF